MRRNLIKFSDLELKAAPFPRAVIEDRLRAAGLPIQITTDVNENEFDFHCRIMRAAKKARVILQSSRDICSRNNYIAVLPL
jgi:hypothetical protein